MKRVWLLLLAALLLAGCAGRKTPDTAESTPAVVEETQDLYVSGSAVEQQTAGAIRTYALPDGTCFDIAGMGNNLLVMGQAGLTVVAGEQGEVIATLETGEITSVSVLDTVATGMAYYLPNTRQVVVLNPQLQKVTQLEIPEGIVGRPAISLAKNEVYYSTDNEIRGLNLTTGISRLIRQQAVANQSLLGVYFDGAVLLCKFTDAAGGVSMEYISSETGQDLGNAQGVSDLQTSGEDYFANWQDGSVCQSVFGVRGGESYALAAANLPEDKACGRVGLPAMGGAVEYVETEAGLELIYYDLKQGKCTAKTTIPQAKAPTKIHSDGTYIWLLTANEGGFLYRWEVGKSSVEDENNYIGTLYTQEKPDTEGLTQLRTYADEYQKQYGVKVLFWQDAVVTTGGYTLTPEYHTQVIQARMEELQPVLALFPTKFLQKTVEKGWIQIAFVKTLDGDKDWVQFWEDGDCWVLIAAKANGVDSLLQGMSYAIDSHILGNSRDFDGWNQMNPEGFDYSYAQTVEEKPEYLEGEGKAFTDALAMTYPHEDRCRVFYHAMLPDNGAMFTSATMQQKLLRVCTGIREAYNLDKKTDTYAWEQYLQTSLAFGKE